jgi:hypothetical protein
MSTSGGSCSAEGALAVLAAGLVGVVCTRLGELASMERRAALVSHWHNALMAAVHTHLWRAARWMCAVATVLYFCLCIHAGTKEFVPTPVDILFPYLMTFVLRSLYSALTFSADTPHDKLMERNVDNVPNWIAFCIAIMYMAETCKKKPL